MKILRNYFSRGEKLLWSGSVLLILLSFLIFDRGNPLSAAASVLGVTSLIFNAKGNPFGQILMICFSLLYGWISYTFAYYGEMITYLCMTAPMALFSFISWVRHPYRGELRQVQINRLGRGECGVILLFTAAVTAAFYFILQAFKTANLWPSTVSVATSFLAVCFTFRRSPLFALAYAANDVVLIVLWGLASFSDLSYLSVVVCFVLFLANDLYGFLNWQRMHRRQKSSA